MSKKPEKKELKPCPKSYVDLMFNEGIGRYNQACDDWDRFLPGFNENYTMIDNLLLGLTDYQVGRIAKAISKRIRGEK